MLPSEDEVCFSGVDSVLSSWYQIKEIPNYAEVAGEILFRKYVDFVFETHRFLRSYDLTLFPFVLDSTIQDL